MAEYVRRANGQYALDGQVVKAAEVPQEVKDALTGAPEGTVVDGDGNISEADDGVENAPASTNPPAETGDEDDSADEPAPAEPTPAPADAEQQNPVDSGLQQDEAGMGFPRKNGYTVDIFDLKTPHTEVRNVGGVMVPLSGENYRTKTDAEIRARLDELRKDKKTAKQLQF